MRLPLAVVNTTLALGGRLSDELAHKVLITGFFGEIGDNTLHVSPNLCLPPDHGRFPGCL